MKRWQKALKGKVYDPDAFDQAVEWLEEAHAFIKLIAKERGASLGFHETARELLRKAGQSDSTI
jgi:hypothetical protein